MSQDTQDQELYHKIIDKFEIKLRKEIKLEEKDKHQLRDLNFQYDDKNPTVIESVTFPDQENFKSLANILTKAYKKNINIKSSENLNGSFPVKTTFQNNTKEKKQVLGSNSESGDEDDEITVFKMKQLDFEAAKVYFYETEYSSFFYDVEDYEFLIRTGDVKREKLLVKLKDLKIIPIQQEISDTISVLLSEDTKIIRLKERMVLVGPNAEIKAIQRKLNTKIGNEEMNTPWQDDKDTEDYSSTHRAPSYGGARAKDVTRETTENTRQKNHQFPIKGTTNEMISGKRYINSLNDTTLYIGCTGLKISVHNADITKLRVDCIVNAANRHLKHGGGVAYVISKAAGYDLQYECERHIKEYDSVPVTGVFVSTGGDLPAKHVIHAVGPKWDDYDYSDKNKCTDDLRKTVLTCLLEATKMKMSTIALPSISAAIFRVPKDLCAEAYMHAVKSYDAIIQKKDWTALKEIHFVDINDTMIDTINENFLKLWREDILQEFYEEDLNFAVSYMKKQSQSLNISRDKPYKQNYQEKQDVVAGSHSNTISRPKEYKGEERKSAAFSNHTASKILAHSLFVRHIKLGASPKLAFEFKPNLVIIIGDPFDKLSGHSEFKTADLHVIDMGKRINNVKTFTSTMRDQDPIYVFQLAIDEFNQEQLEKSFKNLEPAVGLMKDPLTSLVVTSKFLFTDNKNSKKSAFSKSVGKFAQLVYEFVRDKTDKMDSLKYVTVTASEDILPHIVKVFQSREKDRTAPGAYPHNQSTSRPASSGKQRDKQQPWK